MASYRRTAKAEADLEDIYLYIAQDNPTAAHKLLSAIDRKANLLAENPLLGQARPEIAAGLRHFPVGRYLLLYREIPDGIELVRVIAGGFASLTTSTPTFN